MVRIVGRGIVFLLYICGWAAGARADILDLTNPAVTSSGWINGAYIEYNVVDSGGNGVLEPVVQLEGSSGSVTEAYNTNVNGVLDNKNTNTYNTGLQVKDLRYTIGADGNVYFEFLFDANEPANDPARYLSVDRFQIYESNSPNSFTTAFDPNGFLPLGELVYNLGTGGTAPGSVADGNHILLNSKLKPGSGSVDLAIYVRAWSGLDLSNLATNETYVYVYSRIGQFTDFIQDSNDDTWGLRASGNPDGNVVPEPQSVVPEPTSIALAGFAGIGLALRALRRRKNAAADQVA